MTRAIAWVGSFVNVYCIHRLCNPLVACTVCIHLPVECRSVRTIADTGPAAIDCHVHRYKFTEQKVVHSLFYVMYRCQMFNSCCNCVSLLR